jgi:protein TonB
VEQTVDVVEPKIPGISNRGPIILSPRPFEDRVPIEILTPPAPIPLPPTPEFNPVAAAPRTSPGGWVTTNDYPTRDLRQGNEGTAEFTLMIGTDGRVSDCRITRSSGHPGLDQATCGKVSQRARFTPARNDRNQPMTGSYTGRITWVIPD